MGLFKRRKKEPEFRPVVYSEAELACVEAHIARWFGDYDQVFHELVSPDIHVDVAMVPHSEERPWQTLVTMGMGARPMNVPPELAGAGADRAELLISLPAGWLTNSEEERWYWPIRWLKTLARFPGENNTWLGWGHSLDAGGPLAEGVGFAAFLLIWPAFFDEDARVCALPGGGKVNFYQVVPLYVNEMRYKQTHNAEALLEMMDTGRLGVLDVERPDYVDRQAPKA